MDKNCKAQRSGMILMQVENAFNRSAVTDKAEIQIRLAFQRTMFIVLGVSVNGIQGNILYIRVRFFYKNGHAGMVISKCIANDGNNYCKK